jgi:hypothetical protein
MTNNSKMKGWIVFYKDSQLELEVKDFDSLYSAKQYAIKHFKVSKNNEWRVNLEVAY